MPDMHRKIRFQITHPSIDPEVISARLGLRASHAWRCGDPRITPTGRKVGGVRGESYWSTRFPVVDPEDLEPALADACARLKAHQAFLRELVAEGGSLSLTVATFGSDLRGVLLSWRLMKTLASLRISLGWEIYQ